MSDVKITRITETRRGRYALFCGEEFLFSVDDETLVVYHIQEGSSLSWEELSCLREASDIRKAKNQALRYLSLRAYAEQELYKKLCLKYDEPTAAAATAAMCELGLLNDREFAVEKAKGLAARGKSSFEIKRQLTMLGVAQDILEYALLQAEPDDEATALRLVQKSYMEKLRSGQRQKVMAALARRGFKHGVVVRAVQKAEEELGQQNTEENGFETDYF